MSNEVPRDACPECGKPLAAHALDFTSEAPLVVVTCPPGAAEQPARAEDA